MAVLGDTAAIGIDDVIAATFDGDLVALDRALDRVFAEGGNPVQLVRALQRHADQLHLVSGHAAQGRQSRSRDVQGARPARAGRSASASSVICGAGRCLGSALRWA